MLCKELKRFVGEHPSITFLDVRDEAFRWSEEEKKPSKTFDSSSHEVSTNSTECNSSITSTPLQQILDALPQQQKSIEELTKAMKAMAPAKSQDGDKMPRHLDSTCRSVRKC